MTDCLVISRLYSTISEGVLTVHANGRSNRVIQVAGGSTESV